MRPTLSLLSFCSLSRRSLHRDPVGFVALRALGLTLGLSLAACAVGQTAGTVEDASSTGSAGGGVSGGGAGSPVTNGGSTLSGNNTGSAGGQVSSGGGGFITTTGGGSPVDFENQPTCDGNLALDSQDPMDALRAIDLCKQSTGAGDWGVVSAAWVLADGTPAPNTPAFHMGHGILSNFGPNVGPKGGNQLLVLSTGTARRPGDPGYNNTPDSYTKGISGASPTGFPKPSPKCGSGTSTGAPQDIAAVEAVIRTPPGAQGITFDFNFFTKEWPRFVCDSYNDVFVALLEPKPANLNQPDNNIAFDTQGNPICVNNAFLSVCGCQNGPPCIETRYNNNGPDTEYRFDCPKGNAELQGNGFAAAQDLKAGEDHGSTSWLNTSAPVPENSEIKLRFAIYDSQDAYLDSTVVVDHFKWVGVPVSTVTNPVQ